MHVLNQDKNLTKVRFLFWLKEPESYEASFWYHIVMKQTITLFFPAKGRWRVYAGGDTEDLNHHHSIAIQEYAFDFVGIGDDGKSYRNEGKVNEDYFVFGRPVFAPADGTVVEAITGVHDNVPLQTNRHVHGGNYVLIEHTKDEYSFIAHLKYESTLVKAGDKVVAGQKIGECGNSGNSGEPHIHYHLQSSKVHSQYSGDEVKPIAMSIKTFFTNIGLEKDDKIIIKPVYSPVKDDIINIEG